MARAARRTQLDPTDPLSPDHPLNVAVRAISVFRGWQEMQQSMLGGYVPTLRVDDNVAPTEQLKEQTRLVIAACRAAGHRIYAPVYDPRPDETVPPVQPLCSVGGCWLPRVAGTEYCPAGPSHRLAQP
jgi:hypothetical protein